MHKLASVLASGLVVFASNAFADDVVTVRVISYESVETLTQMTCELVGVADVGGRGRLFDIAVEGKRCSSLPPQSDAIPLRVHFVPQSAGWNGVVFEADVPEGTSQHEMTAAVDGAARELFGRLRTGTPRTFPTAPPPPQNVHDTPRVPVGGYVAPTIVPYEGGAIRSDAKIVTKPNTGLLGSGVGLFAASYGGALIYALSTCSAQENCRPGSSWLYIPVIGPFITAAASDTPTTGGRALAAFDGGVQLLGGALAVASFVWPKKFVLWQDKGASVQVTPTTLGAGTSAGVAVTVTHF